MECVHRGPKELGVRSSNIAHTRTSLFPYVSEKEWQSFLDKQTETSGSKLYNGCSQEDRLRQNREYQN